MALDHVVARFERVDLGAERQARDRVDREALQIGLKIDPLASLCGLAPPLLQPTRDGAQLRQERSDVPRSEARHHHASLVPPRVALGREQPRSAPHLDTDLAQSRAAPETVGAVAQQCFDDVVVGNDEQPRRPQAHPEQRSVLPAPTLHVLVDACRTHLRQVADQRPAARTRQLIDAAQALRRGCRRRKASGRRRGFGVHVHDVHSDPIGGDDAPCLRLHWL